MQSKLTTHELATIIDILNSRRVWAETHNKNHAPELAAIVSKLGYVHK